MLCMKNTPSNRQLKKLWEICKFQNWFTFKSELFREKWEPILRISNIQNNWFSDDKLVFFDVNDYDNLDNYIVYPWELVIAMSWATTWKLAINNKNKNYYLNQRVGKFIFKEDVTKKYCHYFLWTKIEENLHKSSWSAIPNLSTKQILEIQIPLPPLEEQKKIVAYLDELNATISKLKSEYQSQLAMLDEMRNSSLDLAFWGSRERAYNLNNWKWVKLAEVCEILDSKRKPITQKDRIDWPYPYYWATWIVDYVNDYLFDEKLVLIWEDWAKWGSGDNTAFSVEGKIWVNNHAHVLRPFREQLCDDFLIYYLLIKDLSEYITGTTVPKLNQEKLKNIEIPLPDLETQSQIVSHLDQVHQQITMLKTQVNSQIEHCDELWQSCLEKVLTQGME